MTKLIFNILISVALIKVMSLLGFVSSHEISPPTEIKPNYIYFQTNSILSCNDSLNQIDSTRCKPFDYVCNEMISILQNNPSITIELVGHASTVEKNHELLSLYRAQIIKEILVAKNIKPKRITVIGWGNHKLLIKDGYIKKAKSEEEKKSLHMKNQRAFFRITSWDFKE